jgi:hypothetical protein
VGQCLFYHLADPVVRNLLSAEDYSELDVAKLAQHILDFSLSSIGRPVRNQRKGAVR